MARGQTLNSLVNKRSPPPPSDFFVFPSNTKKRDEFLTLAFTKNNSISFRQPLISHPLPLSKCSLFPQRLHSAPWRERPSRPSQSTSKLASWQEQEVPSKHSNFLLSAKVTDTCLNSDPKWGQMPLRQAQLLFSFFPPLTGANVSPVHHSPSLWRQPFFMNAITDTHSFLYKQSDFFLTWEVQRSIYIQSHQTLHFLHHLGILFLKSALWNSITVLVRSVFYASSWKSVSF